jgi:hypothetical protein
MMIICLIDNETLLMLTKINISFHYIIIFELKQIKNHPIVQKNLSINVCVNIMNGLTNIFGRLNTTIFVINLNRSK